MLTPTCVFWWCDHDTEHTHSVQIDVSMNKLLSCTVTTVLRDTLAAFKVEETIMRESRMVHVVLFCLARLYDDDGIFRA